MPQGPPAPTAAGLIDGSRRTLAGLRPRNSPIHQLQGVELSLELCETGELQIEVSTVGRDLAAKLVDHRAETTILSSLAAEHFFDLRHRGLNGLGPCHSR